jgi:cobyrinic acid a,c-diamide synthase
VLGALPKLEGTLLPSRHLGLVPPAEHDPAEKLRDTLANLMREHCDLERLHSIAQSATHLAPVAPVPASQPEDLDQESGTVRIGILRDSAFTFYYPENLEALQRLGAKLVPLSALADAALPQIDALYIGGGFPETHIEQLAANRKLHTELRRAAQAGLPIYAECGGLMLLAESLQWQGEPVPMAGVLPIRVRMHQQPQGHGYCRMRVDHGNPFLPVGTELRGHEFHYSQVILGDTPVQTAYAIQKGTGCFENRDGIVCGNTLASYLHLHAVATPEWAPGLVKAAAAYRNQRPADAGAADEPQRRAGGAC